MYLAMTFIVMSAILGSCFPKSNNELEALSEDVLKSKKDEGIEIDVKPLYMPKNQEEKSADLLKMDY